MRNLAIAACILLTGCAASQTATLPASSQASATPSAADAAQITPQLEIDASAREEEVVVCQREAPLGSRIPVTRCYPSKQAETAESVAREEQQRQDLEEMRRQRDLLLEQQRIQSVTGVTQP